MNTTARALATAAVIAISLALCSCGSTKAGAAQTSSPYAVRYAEAPPMLVQCGFDRGSVSPHGTQPWYELGKVLPFTGGSADGHRAEFGTWWDSYRSTTVNGKSLAQWQAWAAGHDQLPQALCGSFATVSGLHAQIFPGQPDPWQS